MTVAFSSTAGMSSSKSVLSSSASRDMKKRGDGVNCLVVRPENDGEDENDEGDGDDDEEDKVRLIESGGERLSIGSNNSCRFSADANENDDDDDDEKTSDCPDSEGVVVALGLRCRRISSRRR